MGKAVIPVHPVCRTTPLPIPQHPPCPRHSPKGSLDQSRALDNKQAHTSLWDTGRAGELGTPLWDWGMFQPFPTRCKGAGAPQSYGHTGPSSNTLWHQGHDPRATVMGWPHTLPGYGVPACRDSQDPAHLLSAPLVSCIPALESCQREGKGFRDQLSCCGAHLSSVALAGAQTHPQSWKQLSHLPWAAGQGTF